MSPYRLPLQRKLKQDKKNLSLQLEDLQIDVFASWQSLGIWADRRRMSSRTSSRNSLLKPLITT